MDFFDKYNIPIFENNDKCSYFPELHSRACYLETDFFNSANECDFKPSQLFHFLKQKGFCRSGSFFYTQNCYNCSQCIPIRIQVDKFEISKSQRKILNKNHDIEIKIEKNPENFYTDEKVRLYQAYYQHHNPEENYTYETSFSILKEIAEYDLCWNMEYRLNGKLIGVGIIDLTQDLECNLTALSSNYFYYDVNPDVLKRSIGVFSVLKEIELCKELKISKYYLGLFLPECRKMNYKINYKPYELLINNKWFFMPSAPELCINTDYQIDFYSPGEIMPELPDIVLITDDIPLQLLYCAYKNGVFPWFNDEDETEPVLWQSPEYRYIINPSKIHIPKSLEKFLKKNPYTYTVDKCFDQVIENCRKQYRPGQMGTWIGNRIIKAYTNLHKAGFAHSIEVWHEGKLAGGFYGVLIGNVFCGESMFTIEPNSSKSAFVLFAQAFSKCGGKLIDCQVYTENMARYEGEEIPRKQYLSLLKRYSSGAIDFEKLKKLIEELN